MHVQYVALCDQIILGTDGRPSLIGLFNDLNVPTLPFTLPRLAFAARLLLTAEEVGRGYKVEIVISDPAGNELGRPGGDLALPAPPAGIDSVAVDIPFQFDFFEIPASGRYTFLLQVDEKPLAAVQLSIRKAQVA